MSGSAPGEAADRSAAEARVEAFLDALDRLGAEDFERVSVVDDAATREQARDVARRTADAAGLGPVLEDATSRARSAVATAFAADQYQPTMFGLNWARSSGRTADRIAVADAARDAAMAAVVADRVDEATLATLLAPFQAIVALRAPARPSPADTADGGRRAGRRDRWRTALSLLLVAALLPSLVVAAAAAGVVAVVIPVLMIVAIIALAARAAGRA